jgi:hypothetical protein
MKWKQLLKSVKRNVLRLAAISALMPLLAVCGAGEAPAITAAAQERAAPEAQAAIYINEILAHTDEPQVDTLELYNAGAAAVDLQGWCISDDGDNLLRYCIPPPPNASARPIVEAGGYFLVTATELGFAFSEFGDETVYLSAPTAAGRQIVDSARFGVSPNGVSLGRHVTSTGDVHFSLQRELTLGRANAGPYVPPVVIGGIVYNPLQGPEYLLLTNASSLVVPLYDVNHPENRWRVLGIDNNNKAYKLPAQTILQPGESVVLTSDPQAFAAAFPNLGLRVLGPYEGKLANEGERIVLQAPQPPETNGDVAYADLDVVEYGVAAPWPDTTGGGGMVRRNLTGYGDDPSNWRAAPNGLPGSARLLLPLVSRGEK